MQDLEVLAQQPLGYAGGRLDRADHVRTRPDLVAEAFASPNARLLVLDGLEPITVDGGLLFDPVPPEARLEDHMLLGLTDRQDPIFIRLVDNAHGGFVPSARSRAIATELPADQVALYGTARSLLHWHARHPFCACCGSRTAPEKAGWARRCGSCNAEHFPRVDPVVIMLAEYRGRVLVGRQHSWPPRSYSALAGFLEPGETIEDAVAREIKEEAGLAVHSVRYVMSQPWPFPSSLMIACIAQAEDDALTLDETEIEHAMWVDADDIRAALTHHPDAPFNAPPPLAVAWHLLRHWFDGQVAPTDPSA